MAIKKRDESLDAFVKAENRLEELELQQQCHSVVRAVTQRTEFVCEPKLQSCKDGSSRKAPQRTGFAGDIPPMPDLIPADFVSWTDDRQAELQLALAVETTR